MFNIDLRKTRKKRGMTQQALANQLQVSVDTISRWEAGKRRPKYDDILSLSQILNVPIDVFFTSDPETDNEPSKDFSILMELSGSNNLSGFNKILIFATFTKMAIEQTTGLSCQDHDILKVLLDRVIQTLKEKKPLNSNL